MIELNGLNIRVSHGDYFPLRIDLTGEDGEPYVLREGDIVTFAIRDADFSAVSGGVPGQSYVDFVIPTDMFPRRYDYDISIQFADSRVSTLMWTAKFTVERTARQ